MDQQNHPPFSLAQKEAWKAKWEVTPALQSEFPTADAYAAFMKYEARKAAGGRRI